MRKQQRQARIRKSSKQEVALSLAMFSLSTIGSHTAAYLSDPAAYRKASSPPQTSAAAPHRARSSSPLAQAIEDEVVSTWDTAVKPLWTVAAKKPISVVSEVSGAAIGGGIPWAAAWGLSRKQPLRDNPGFRTQPPGRRQRRPDGH